MKILDVTFTFNFKQFMDWLNKLLPDQRESKPKRMVGRRTSDTGGWHPKEQPGHVRGEPPKGYMPVQHGTVPEFLPYPCCGLGLKPEYQVVSVKGPDGADLPYRVSMDGRHVTVLLGENGND